MSARSWFVVPAEDDALALPATLRARDPRGAVDVGFVEQMSPFVERFTGPGDVVLDPFAGFGSTLVAAGRARRRGIGVELARGRVALARHRLRALGLDGDVVAASALALPVADAMVDLVLTNVPYFEGTRLHDDGDAFGARRDRASYDAAMARAVDEMARVTRPGGYAVILAENVRGHDDVMVPLAWDWGRALGARFTLRDEVILLYESPRARRRARHDGTDRSHEYALVGERAALVTDDDVREVVRALTARGVPAVVIGSVAGRALDEDRWRKLPRDLDLAIPPDPALTRAALDGLVALGFAVSSWGTPIDALPSLVVLDERNYLRGRRGALVVDVTTRGLTIPFAELAARAVVKDGVPLASTPDLDALDDDRRRERAARAG